MRRHAKAIVAISATLLTLALGATIASAVAPTVTIEDATDVEYTTAKVKGTVDPGDHETSYHFEAATEADFSNVSAFAGFGSLVANAGAQTIEAKFDKFSSNLQPATTYHVRLVAENDEGGRAEAVASSTFTTKAVAPPSIAIDPVMTFTDTTAHFSGTIDPEAPDDNPEAEGFEVNWRFECTPACPGLEGFQTAPAGSVSHPEANATGLQPNTDYEVTLVASSAGGQVEDGPEAFKTLGVGPQTQTLYAGVVDTDSALLGAQVNPKNDATTYQFEWGTSSSFGNLAPVTPQPLGAADNTFHVVTAPLSGLAPNTTYHFRVLATNGADTTEGIERTFTTLSTTPVEFPARGMEKVSPDDKNNVAVGGRAAKAISPDGNRVLFSFEGIAPDAAKGAPPTPYFASRIPSGWTPQSIDGPTSSNLCSLPTPYYASYNTELTEGIYRSDVGLTPGSHTGEPNLYRRQIPSGAVTQLNPRPACPSRFSANLFLYGTSDDYHSLLIDAKGPEALTDDGIDGKPNAYVSTDGVTRLVGVLPDGSVPPSGSQAASARDQSLLHLLSGDGSRAFFMVAEPDAFLQRQGQLYARTDDGLNPPSTVHVSASQRTVPDPAGPLPAVYWNAEAEHGDKVLFSSCEKLTDDSTAEVGAETQNCSDPNQVGEGLGHAAPTGSELYLFDVESGGLEDLTVSPDGGGRLLGVVGASKSLDRIYFAAEGALAPGAIDGQFNLYLWESGATKFVATLQGEDVCTSSFEATGGGIDLLRVMDCKNWDLSSWNHVRVSRVSDDGQSLLFVSRAQLTGYDNRNLEKCAVQEANTNELLTDGCAEVYLYRADTEQLHCLSCPPDGELAMGDATLNSDRSGASVPDEAPQNITSVGFFFETPEPLAAEDIDGRRDVYQWRQGQLDLVSPGDFDANSSFIDSTPDGSTALVRTLDRLVGADRDTIADVYAARVGGGFPETPLPLPCQGDACRGPVSVPPPESTPSSSSFSGPGNQKGQKKKKNRKGKKQRKGHGKQKAQKRGGKRGGGK